jgi:DNA-binding NtrC family response regulator
MKLLLIDDDEELLGMVSRRLTKKGAVTLCATNLSSAKNIVQKNSDITGIICDLFLADGENGIQFYEEYIQGKYAVKFILATGDTSANPKIAQYLKNEKLFKCVEKPYSMDNVLELFK